MFYLIVGQCCLLFLTLVFLKPANATVTLRQTAILEQNCGDYF